MYGASRLSVCFCAVMRVCFCTGHLVMVPLTWRLTCLHCLQHVYFYFYTALQFILSLTKLLVVPYCGLNKSTRTGILLCVILTIDTKIGCCIVCGYHCLIKDFCYTQSLRTFQFLPMVWVLNSVLAKTYLL